MNIHSPFSIRHFPFASSRSAQAAPLGSDGQAARLGSDGQAVPGQRGLGRGATATLAPATLAPATLAPATPRASSRAAFTMVEMISVVLIISLLLGVTSTAISGARRTAMRTHSLDTVRQLVSAWSQYVADQGHFPLESKFKDAAQGFYKASPQNIGGLLNTQYLADGKTPYSGSVIYFETTEDEVERKGSASNYSYTGTGVLDRWKNPLYFNLDFDLVGRVDNPVTGQKVNSSAIAFSTAGFGLSDMSKYGKKFLVAY